MPATIDLLDANLWLALAHESHTHHQRAQRYWDSEGLPTAGFCRVTQMAFLRLMTNQTIMKQEVLAPGEAWQKCRDFLALPEVQFLGEPPGLDDQWAAYSSLGRTSPNLWTDSYLAAFASCAGLRLVTFDRGFIGFPGVETLILGPEASSAAS